MQVQLHCPSTLCVCVWGADLYAESAEFLLLFDFLIWLGLEKSKESSVRWGKFPGTTKSG